MHYSDANLIYFDGNYIETCGRLTQSAYEKDRIIPQSFGKTEMGRDLLAEDYMLKQITASLIYPEDKIGKEFWRRIYQEATKKFGTTNIPVNTFNKVWIVPETAVVYENPKAGTAFVVDSKLKVMLEQDYLSLEKHTTIQNNRMTSELGSQVVREIIIPELTREVNDGKNFSQLRQVYNSLILATWYKNKIRDSILEQVYADKNKIQGLGPHDGHSQLFVIPGKAGIQNKNNVEYVYQQYLQAFKKGVFNFIKEDTDPVTQEVIPRKYFSGGWEGTNLRLLLHTILKINYAQFSKERLIDIASQFSPIQVPGKLMLADQSMKAEKIIQVKRKGEHYTVNLTNGTAVEFPVVRDVYSENKIKGNAFMLELLSDMKTPVAYIYGRENKKDHDILDLEGIHIDESSG